MKVRRQRKSSLAVDMSPLIDCVFQLLVFFMLSSTFLTPSMRVRLPSADSDDRADVPGLVVTVQKDGSLDVNGQPVSIDRLEQEVANQLAAAERKSVTIRGDHEAPYRIFVETLAKVRRAGATQVDIAHETSP